MKRVWAWIKARLRGGGRRCGAPVPAANTAGGGSTPQVDAEGPRAGGAGTVPPGVETPCGRSDRYGDEKRPSGTLTATDDGCRLEAGGPTETATTAALESRAPETATAHGNGCRLEAGGPRNDDGTVAERLEQLRVRLKEIEEAMAAGDTDEAGGDGEADVLAKAHVAAGTGAHRACAPTTGEGGVEMGGEMTVAVSRGVPQGIPGQQARRKAARFWEGVL